MKTFVFLSNTDEHVYTCIMENEEEAWNAFSVVKDLEKDELKKIFKIKQNKFAN